ncbi:hypothetical protein [Lutimaribacter saemankumensis]|uniref:hypothetical protein n=1 Tax=Lutimaribacter saemankumensis TaxID=490829 RepID=UPI001587941C|nr:hypothetical protein [Lutimaribacter saemankumensis]
MEQLDSFLLVALAVYFGLAALLFPVFGCLLFRGRQLLRDQALALKKTPRTSAI